MKKKIIIIIKTEIYIKCKTISVLFFSSKIHFNWIYVILFHFLSNIIVNIFFSFLFFFLILFFFVTVYKVSEE